MTCAGLSSVPAATSLAARLPTSPLSSEARTTGIDGSTVTRVTSRSVAAITAPLSIGARAATTSTEEDESSQTPTPSTAPTSTRPAETRIISGPRRSFFGMDAPTAGFRPFTPSGSVDRDRVVVVVPIGSPPG